MKPRVVRILGREGGIVKNFWSSESTKLTSHLENSLSFHSCVRHLCERGTTITRIWT